MYVQLCKWNLGRLSSVSSSSLSHVEQFPQQKNVCFRTRVETEYKVDESRTYTFAAAPGGTALDATEYDAGPVMPPGTGSSAAVLRPVPPGNGYYTAGAAAANGGDKKKGVREWYV